VSTDFLSGQGNIQTTDDHPAENGHHVVQSGVSSRAEIDAALAILRASAGSWVETGAAARMRLLDQVQHDLLGVSRRWIATSLAAKGFVGSTLGEAEEWLYLATVLRAVRLTRKTLTDIVLAGQPRLPGPIRRLPNGQIAVQVFPGHRIEGLVYRQLTGEVWLEPGVTAGELRRTQAQMYRGVAHAGAVAMVLGAGNASMIPVVDTLHKLFVEDQVVILKLNPVNAYLGPLIEEGLQALIRENVLRVVYGGAPEGSYLCRHPAVDELHLTGSHATFETITFGSGPEGTRRKAERRPLLTKRFTCELGNISPVIVVPGPWTPREVREQAEQLATWFVANAGFGCLTPRVLIQHREWPLRHAFLEAVASVLEKVETRRAYYPGAVERHALFVAAHPEARHFGRPRAGDLPWTLISDLDPTRTDDICFRREAFCSVLAETAVSAPSASAFLDRAVAFANTTLWGTLNATLLVHPASLADPAVAEGVERAIRSLRYGSVTVNAAAFAAYYLQVTPWGGYSGDGPADLGDIQSGRGRTANFLMLERAQKSVVRGPFSKRPDPLTVAASRPETFARRLAVYEAKPSPATLLGVLWAALPRWQSQRRD
jgi:hypothetical protein